MDDSTIKWPIWPDFDESHTPLCDFCSQPGIHAVHTSQDFVHEKFQTQFGSINSESVGSWAACRKCDELIQTEQWAKLLDRSVGRFVELFGFEAPGLREHIGRIHNLFRQFHKLPS